MKEIIDHEQFTFCPVPKPFMEMFYFRVLFISFKEISNKCWGLLVGSEIPKSRFF